MQQFTVTIPNPAAAISLLPEDAKDIAVEALILQPRGSNAAKSYIGIGTASATAHFAALNPGSGGNPPAAIWVPAKGMLGQYFAFGAANEIIHVGVVPR